MIRLTSPSMMFTYFKTETWENSIISPLLTVCLYPTAVHYKSAIVDSGSITDWHTDNKFNTYTTAVEVFQTKTFQWHHAEPLPVRQCYVMCHCYTCYFIGGNKSGAASRQAYCTLISNLISWGLPPCVLRFLTCIGDEAIFQQ